jgi:hypothetical protein
MCETSSQSEGAADVPCPERTAPAPDGVLQGRSQALNMYSILHESAGRLFLGWEFWIHGSEVLPNTATL